MMASHPAAHGVGRSSLIACIDACFACAQACQSCADACLAEDMVDELTQCIRDNLDCADLCAVTGKLASRSTGNRESMLLDMLEICSTACQQCAEECERHAEHHEHCRICAKACRDCAAACEDAMESLRDDRRVPRH
jgi:hypothetical protein